MRTTRDIPDWLNEKPSQRVKPPVESRINILPTQDLTWENFERLIYRLVRKRASSHLCRLYGEGGQHQKGIDIIAYPKNLSESRPIVYQCKRIKEISGKDIREIVTTFLNENWDPFPSEFVLCASKSINKTKLIDQIGIERERLAKKNVLLSVWDNDEISALLKGYPDIVEDFFGEAWVRAFIGDVFASSNICIEDIIMNRDESSDLYSYHNLLLSRYRWLELPTPPLGYKGRIELKNVFINLETEERVATCKDISGNVHRILISDIDVLGVNIQCIDNWKIVRMSAIEALKFYSKVVLLGGRGSGKSTVLQYVILCLAAEYIGGQDFGIETLKKVGGTSRYLVPIYIPLVDFSKSDNFGPNANALWDFFKSEYRTTNNAIEPIKKCLGKGRAIIFLDDIHRVPVEKRAITIKAIRDFTMLYPLCRYVMSCREIDYSNDDIILPEFRSVTLAHLDLKKIDKFIGDLYTELQIQKENVPLGSADDLRDAIHNQDLIQLTETPLQCMQIALINWRYGSLPPNKVDICREMFSLFLNSKDIKNLNLDTNTSILENSLYEIAYLAFLEEGKGSSMVQKSQVINVLQKYLNGNAEKTNTFFDFISSPPGLMKIMENELIVFPNRILQEYLVAQYLQSQNDFISRGVDLAKKDFSLWHNIFAAATRLAGVDIGISAVRSMCPFDPPTEIKNIKEKDIDWYSFWMAAEALVEFDSTELMRRPERKEVLERIRRWLIMLIESNALNIIERNEIGKLLSMLGDTRDGVSTIKPYLIKIPKGPVVLGNDKTIKGRTYRCDIPYNYYVSKYPVTNIQYWMFLSENPDYPLPEDEGKVWKTVTRKPNPQFLNHPVIGVSWQDARFYCEWLTRKLKNLNILPKNYIARLPTDAEWMKMYRGGMRLFRGIKNPIPARLYPWGNKWIEGYANVPGKKTSLYQTTTVGIYPKGATPYGVLDACGNVLEWTSTSWGSFDIEVPGFSHPYNVFDGRESPYADGLRIVRGGSWLFSEGDAKCACRLHPLNKFPDTGFRIFIGPKNLLYKTTKIVAYN